MNRDRPTEYMIKTQIVSRGITATNVLNAMRKVDRSIFVPPDQLVYAYDDTPLPIGRGQTISQPYMVAYMTQSLNISPGMKVLEIGTGSGYQTAILAEMGAQVYTIEYIDHFSHTAKLRLTELGYTNVSFKIGSGFEGWKEEAPFDRIIVTCAPPKLPEELVRQLNREGLMILPEGRGVQVLTMVKRQGSRVKTEELMMVRFVPMVN